jgi:hypothetical protein
MRYFPPADDLAEDPARVQKLPAFTKGQIVHRIDHHTVTGIVVGARVFERQVVVVLSFVAAGCAGAEAFVAFRVVERLRPGVGAGHAKPRAQPFGYLELQRVVVGRRV